MGSDIYIVPAPNCCFTWGELKTQLVTESLAPYYKCSLGLTDRNIEFFNGKTKELVREGDFVEPGGPYSVRLSNDISAGISYHKNSDVYTNAHEYVKDFGRNLSRDNQLHVSRIWNDVGHFFVVRGGSTVEQHFLFVIVAKALAKLTSGFVIISERNTMLDLSIGIYTYD